MSVVIVGGGLAGLFTASELTAAGVDDLVVLEQSDHPGGVASTIEQDGFSIEPAAGAFNLPHTHFSPVLERAGVEVEEALGGSDRYVFVGGRLVSLQPSSRALLAPVLSARAKMRALFEPFVPGVVQRDDESLASFCRRRFGTRAGELLAWLMASGVFAGDPEHLSATAAFPKLVDLEKEHGSVVKGALRARKARPPDTPRPSLHVPVGGMTELAARIAASLRGEFRRSFPVESVRPEAGGWVVEGTERLTADAVVLAVRPEVAAGVLGNGVAGELSDGARASRVAVVGLGSAGPSPLPSGYGALVGPDEGMASLGALFESSYAPFRAPEGSWLAKVIVSEAGYQAGLMDGDDEHLASVAQKELGAIVGAELTPSFSVVVRHAPGIPQYPVGHRSWLRKLGTHLAGWPGLHLTGWGYRGVGVSGLATDAARLAREMTRTPSV